MQLDVECAKNSLGSSDNGYYNQYTDSSDSANMNHAILTETTTITQYTYVPPPTYGGGGNLGVITEEVHLTWKQGSERWGGSRTDGNYGGFVYTIYDDAEWKIWSTPCGDPAVIIGNGNGGVSICGGTLTYASKWRSHSSYRMWYFAFDRVPPPTV